MRQPEDVERGASIRRRIPSYQQPDDDEERSSIRVIHFTSLSPHERDTLSPLGMSSANQRLSRKPVPYIGEDEEENEDKERVVIQSGNILMQQAALHAHHRQSYMSDDTTLLPSPHLNEKNEWIDDEVAELDLWPDVIKDGRSTAALDFDVATRDQGIDTLTNSNTAQSALHDLNRSLQWTLKFPQGSHLSRAKSRTTIRSIGSQHPLDKSQGEVNLTEAIAGLRLLAKKREDLIHDYEDTSTRLATWNVYKITLLLTVLIVMILGLLALIITLLTWANTWKGAEVRVIVDTDIVILMTVASSICLATSMVGLSGAMLNSRPILAMYAFLLWPALLSILTVGYTSYKRANLRLDLKLNQTWSRYLDDLARLRIQEVCCGYYTPLHQATFSRQCYPRTTLPGCKAPLYRFEKKSLWQTYTITFSAVFFHLAAIAASILCSNHVNVTFGKGLTPRAYRLDVSHVRSNAVGIIKMLSASRSTVQHPQYQQHLQVDPM